MQTVFSEETLIAELFDIQPEAVLWYVPVYQNEVDETGAVIDFKLAYCNGEVTRTMGVPKEKLLGQTLLTTNLASEELRTMFFSQFIEVWNSGERSISSYYHPTLDKHLEVVRSKVKGGIISITRDRTSEVLKDELYRRDKDLLNSILDASINGVFAMEAVRDEQGEIIDFTFIKINKKFAKVVGKTEEEIIGKSYLSILYPSKENGLFDMKKQVVETGETIEKEFYYKGVGVDGWYNISIARLGTNGVVETFTEITDSKTAKEQLATSVKKFSTVVNTSLAGMFTLIPVFENGEIVDFTFDIVNQAVASYIGQTAEVLQGALASIYFPAYKTNGLFNIYKESFLNNIGHNFDFHYEDGYDLFFNINVVKMEDSVLVTFTDQTNLKRLQRELERTVEELKRSNASLQEFAYAASHDLQEPLRKINFFSDRLKKGLLTASVEENVDIVNRIENSARRMSTLINDLLEFSHISIKLQQFKPVELNRLVELVLQDFEASITETKAIIKVDDLPTINGDERQLHQMLHNLFGNALKYRKPGITPEIGITCKYLKREEAGRFLKEPAKSDYYMIKVCDNGIGFEQENAEKIFQVFQRLHGRAEYEGTGVGLAIVQKVVLNHSGFISAISSPGEGATFTVFLPANG